MTDKDKSLESMRINQDEMATRMIPSLMVLGLSYVQWSSAPLKHCAMHKTSKHLIEGLVHENIIKNAEVARIMEQVDRKFYCPTTPYYDSPQGIGYGVTISAPHMHAWALQLLYTKLTTSKYALDVGSGTGYLTAAMALIMPQEAKVFGIEHVPQLVKQSRQNIERSNPAALKDKVRIEEGDGRLGWPFDKEVQFDAIHVGAAADKIPVGLIEQLAEGGLMIIPVGGEHQTQKFMEVTKRDGHIHEKCITHVRYVPLTDLKKQL